jgi:hypothetical protein
MRSDLSPLPLADLLVDSVILMLWFICADTTLNTPVEN